ncbi:MAG: sodium/proline symporter [Calditrichia bacterium]
MELNAGQGIAINNIAYMAFIAYLFLLVVIGIYSVRFSSRGVNEFFLGGRQMNKLVVALSAVVSGRSGWLLVGVTGMAYLRGLSAIWAIIGYTLMEFFLFLVVAPKLRKQTEDLDALTVPDYFSRKYKQYGGLIRVIASIIIVVFLTSYVSAQLLGGAKTFAASFHISATTGLWLTTIIVLLYTLMGGFLAVALTDVVQAFFMIFGLVILPVYVLIDHGSWSYFSALLNQLNPDLLDITALSAGALIGFLGIGLGSPGNPHIVVRYMSIKNPDELKFSAYVATFWNVVMGVSAIVIGMQGRALFPELSMIPHGDAESIFPFLAQQYLHPVIFGIIVASILAAIMSTTDSMLLVVASTIIRDIYQNMFKSGKDIPQQKLVLYSRLSIIVVILLAVLLGFVADKIVFWLVLFAWGGLGAAFGPALLFSLFWPKTSATGIIAGMISGGLTVILWKQVPYLSSLVYELIPAFIISSLTIVIFSLKTWGNSMKMMQNRNE